jgi:hypothetical protein
MKPGLALLTVAAVVAVGAGCFHSNTSMQSTRLEGAAPVETVMVFTNIADPPFAGAMNLGFEEQLRSGLAACGVRSEFRPVVEDGGESMARSLASMDTMSTNAALVVGEAGGSVTIHSTRQLGTTSTSFDVAVRLVLFDRRADKVTWVGLVNYEGRVRETTVDDGRAFASAVVSRLRSDGIVVGCGT